MPDAQQQIVLRRTERNYRLVQWAPVASNPSLIGRATIAFAGGWCIVGIPVFRGADGTLSAGVPSSAQLDSDGRIKLRDGKKQYAAVLTFETAEARERWQRMVISALADAEIGKLAP